MTKNLAVPYTGDFQTTVFFKTDEVTQWMDIGRGGKSVQGLFEWYEEFIDAGAQPAPAGLRSLVGMGSVTITSVSLADERTFMPIIWTKEALDTDWELVGSPSPQDHINTLEFQQGGMDREIFVFVPQRAPLSSGPSDTIQITYSYTPYQGLSSDGGKAAVVDAALKQELKDLLHGEILENTDFFVTQAGASSYFSGIECWTGIPVSNHNSRLDGFAFPSARFETYNHPDLVQASPALGGIKDAGPARALKGRNIGAAVLRLPFPINVGMAGVNYHTVVADWELDPARAGVGSGHFSYAPAYYGGEAFAESNYIKYDQFVNGLARLLDFGDERQKQVNAFFRTGVFRPTSINSASAYPDHTTQRYLCPNGDQLSLFLDLPTEGRHLVQRIVTAIENGNIADEILATAGALENALRVYNATNRSMVNPTSVSNPERYLLNESSATSIDYAFTSRIGFPTPNQKWYVCYQPGVILVNRMINSSDYLPILEIGMLNTSGPPDIFFEGSLITMETNFEAGHNKANQVGGPFQISDLIVLPFRSSSLTTMNRAATRESGLTSLKGLRVGYPSGWSAGTITAAENLYTASIDARGAGRGIYMGDATARLTMPVLVPGSGDTLSFVNDVLAVGVDAEESPAAVPYMSSINPFAPSAKRNFEYDHGGPIAYSCFAIAFKPSSDKYKNKVVMQVAGGTNCKGIAGNLYAQEDLDGTALDAFWPTHRPILDGDE
jgi:hypothetical protein